jgi:hypothetical protein
VSNTSGSVDRCGFERVCLASWDLTPPLASTAVRVRRNGRVVEVYATIRFGEDLSIDGSLEIAELRDLLELRRNAAPGNLIPADARIDFEAIDGTFAVEGALSYGEQQNYGRQAAPQRLDLHIERLLIPSRIDRSSIHHHRILIRNGKVFGGWTWRGRAIGIRTLDEAQRLQAICIEGTDSLAETDGESLWNFVCFLNGCEVQCLCDEWYSGDGRLLQQDHQRGTAPFGSPVPIFASRYFSPKISADAISSIHGAFDAMHAARFDIARVLGHIFRANAAAMEEIGLHLILSIHAAMSEWLKYWKRRAGVAGDDSAQRTRTLQKVRAGHIPARAFARLLPSLERAVEEWTNVQSLPGSLSESLRRSVRAANRLTIVDQVEQFLADDLDMALGEDDRRALGYRNQLAHDGGFQEDFLGLAYEAQNERNVDLNRLQNIAVEVVLRLCGYSGPAADFTSPGNSRSIFSRPSPFSPGSAPA